MQRDQQDPLQHALQSIKPLDFFLRREGRGRRLILSSPNLHNRWIFFPLLSSTFALICPRWFARGISYHSVTVSEATRVVIHLHECYLTHQSQNMQMQRTVKLFSGVKLYMTYLTQWIRPSGHLLLTDYVS